MKDKMRPFYYLVFAFTLKPHMCNVKLFFNFHTKLALHRYDTRNEKIQNYL